MTDELDEFLDFMDREHNISARIPKRYIRDQSNPLEYFYEEAFTKRYRFTKDQVIHFILPLVNEKLKKANNRGLPVSPILQLIMALRFYATGNYQAVTGDLRNFSQATVCRCIKIVSTALAEELHNYIQFPTTIDEQRKNIRKFYQIARFPNVAGCIDDTLIKIACPSKQIGKMFRCRKGFFALNILATVGPRGEFLFIDVRHPDSTHDNTCFDRSALKLYFEQN